MEDYIPSAGMIIDFKDIKRFVGPVVDQFDHAYLNGIIDNPTAENLVIIIRDEILNTPIGLGLVRLRLWETEGCYCEWTK